MLPYKTLIPLDRTARSPLYIQIANSMIRQITAGIIPVGLKLPGARKLAEFLSVSRRTAMLAYEELEAQGWISIMPSQGTFVSTKIPTTKKQYLATGIQKGTPAKSHFEWNKKLDFLGHYQAPNFKKVHYVFDTGYPDVRLAPLKALGQAINRVLTNKRNNKIMNYAADFKGHISLRKELLKYLAESRGIHSSIDNLLLTRGSLMAFSNIFQVLLAKGDKVIVGDTSFQVAKNIIKIAGGSLLTIPVDEEGMDVAAIEKIGQQQSIRAVFVMPHHHHPTTVSLSAARRMKLLQLAEKYRFAIVEDDYDYDFHYASSPILPMASSDHKGVVIYVGSLSKTVAPGLRLGFVLAPEDFIKDLSRLSRFMDVHGNTAMEKAIAHLFQEGIIRRHLKKSLKVYRQRRNLFCALLRSELGEYVSFKVPEGGLAVWVTFDKKIPLPPLRDIALQQGLLISKTVFQNSQGKDLNAIRMGFASLNEAELQAAISLLKKAIIIVTN